MTRKKILAGITAVFCLIGGAAGACRARDNAPVAAEKAAYHAMTAEDAKARMDSGDAVLVLDVRTKAEYDEGHIPGAVSLPNEMIDETRTELPEDMDAEILVYCRSGRRSKEATEKLAALGYRNAHDFGGIISWPYGTTRDS